MPDKAQPVVSNEGSGNPNEEALRHGKVGVRRIGPG